MCEKMVHKMQPAKGCFVFLENFHADISSTQRIAFLWKRTLENWISSTASTLLSSSNLSFVVRTHHFISMTLELKLSFSFSDSDIAR